MVLALLALFLLWRIDSPRVERFRAALVDRVVPSFDWAMAPVTKVAGMVDDFQSYTRIYEQNQELRRELQQMKAWKEAALQLEQKNARLLDLNKVRLDPKLTHVTGVVMADSGSPFRQSVLLNVGARDGIRDGWATMDGIGLVGRISGVGQTHSRVILLTDSNSRIPVTIQPSGQKALLSGDNSSLPPLEFLEKHGRGPPRRPGGDLGRWRRVPGRTAGRTGRAGHRRAAAGAAGRRLRAAGVPARPAQPRERTDHRTRRPGRRPPVPRPSPPPRRGCCGRSTDGGDADG